MSPLLILPFFSLSFGRLCQARPVATLHEALRLSRLLPASQRRLFPMVEPTYLPFTVDGFTIPEAEQAIRHNIVYLHQHLLGEELGLNDPEIEATYQLWLDVMLEGQAAIAAGEQDTWLRWECRATTWDGLTIPPELQITTDDDYTIRAWSVVLMYMLTDYRFVHE